MRMHPFHIVLPLALAAAACTPVTAEYTDVEAPKQLVLDGATTQFPVRFVRGSNRLAAGEAARLRGLAATGSIAPADRVLVAAAGAPGLAAARSRAVADELLHYGIVATPATFAATPRDGATVEVVRYMVTLPPCPNWSGPNSLGFTRTLNSNFGCATASNLGRMVAYPADLASGQPLGLAAGKPARDAVRRYLNDIDPAGPGIKPYIGSAAGSASGAGGGGGGGAGGGAGGSTGGTTGSE